MKIRAVRTNSRKSAFEVTAGKRVLQFPYSKCDPRPSKENPVIRAFIDCELGHEAFTYVLRCGRESTVHVEQILDYNQDPAYLRDLLLHKLTIEARKRLERSELSRRELIRRLGTSASQFYRLIDQTNYRKSVDQMLALLHVLDCDVELVVRSKPNSSKARAASKAAGAASG